MPDGQFISWFDAAAVSGIINALFVALLVSWRGRIRDLKDILRLADERIANLTEALEECYEDRARPHTHGTDLPPAP